MLTVEEIREFYRKVDTGQILCPATRVEQVYHYSVGRLIALIDGAVRASNTDGSASDAIQDMLSILGGNLEEKKDFDLDEERPGDSQESP